MAGEGIFADLEPDAGFRDFWGGIEETMRGETVSDGENDVCR